MTEVRMIHAATEDATEEIVAFTDDRETPVEYFLSPGKGMRVLYDGEATIPDSVPLEHTWRKEDE